MNYTLLILIFLNNFLRLKNNLVKIYLSTTKVITSISIINCQLSEKKKDNYYDPIFYSHRFIKTWKYFVYSSEKLLTIYLQNVTEYELLINLHKLSSIYKTKEQTKVFLSFKTILMIFLNFNSHVSFKFLVAKP